MAEILVKRVVLERGHTLYKLNLETGLIKPTTILTDKNGKKNVDNNDDCMYFGALNYKNAVKKSLKIIKELTEKIESDGK